MHGIVSFHLAMRCLFIENAQNITLFGVIIYTLLPNGNQILPFGIFIFGYRSLWNMR